MSSLKINKSWFCSYFNFSDWKYTDIFVCHHTFHIQCLINLYNFFSRARRMKSLVIKLSLNLTSRWARTWWRRTTLEPPRSKIVLLMSRRNSADYKTLLPRDRRDWMKQWTCIRYVQCWGVLPPPHHPPHFLFLHFHSSPPKSLNSTRVNFVGSDLWVSAIWS